MDLFLFPYSYIDVTTLKKKPGIPAGHYTPTWVTPSGVWERDAQQSWLIHRVGLFHEGKGRARDSTVLTAVDERPTLCCVIQNPNNGKQYNPAGFIDVWIKSNSTITRPIGLMNYCHQPTLDALWGGCTVLSLFGGGGVAKMTSNYKLCFWSG